MERMKRFMALFLVMVMAVTSLPLTALAAPMPADVTYFVANSKADPSGSDETGDGTREKPFLSISHAIEAANLAGKTAVNIELLSNIKITKTLNIGDNKVKDITFTGNHYAIEYAGDAPLGVGTAAVTVTNGTNVQFINMALTRQEGLNYAGGVLYVQDASVTLDSVRVENGRMAAHDLYDGGSAIQVAGGGNVTLTGKTVITNNTNDGKANTAGAVMVFKNGTLNINSVEISGNMAAARGTGIYVQEGGNLNMYSRGGDIRVSDEIYLAVGSHSTVGADEGQSSHIALDRVWLETSPRADRSIATLDIAGDTSDASINVEMDPGEEFHYAYRLIANEASGYSIQTALGNMDETGWNDICGEWDIRYMNYKGVPGLYLYYHTLNATFHDVNTLTGIQGLGVTGEPASYYNPEEIQNSSVSDGVLTIPEIIPMGNGDYEITFTCDEANKDYRIPTEDQIELTLNGVVLVKNQDYVYTPDFTNGSATIRVLAKFLEGKSGTLDFKISAEKYSLLTLEMNGPVYTMKTDITGQIVDQALSVAEVVNDGKNLTYDITRHNTGVPNVTVVLYQEGTANKAATEVTNADGRVEFTGLDDQYSYYYVLYYTDSFYVIARDTVSLVLSTLEGQKLAKRHDFDAHACDSQYTVADAENFSKATAVITNVTADTKVSYYVDQAQDTITFIGNPGDSTTKDTLTYYYTGSSYKTENFSKVMETNANTYGNLPGLTMTGYVFQGWFTDPVGGEQVIHTTPYDTVTSAKTLYAHWIPADNVKYDVQHWVEYVEKGVNPGWRYGETPTKEVNGVLYYLWQTDSHNDGVADSVLPDVMDKALTSMEDPAHSWWTLDGFHISSDKNCKVLADGSAVFGCYYDRNVYTIKFDPTEGSMTTELAAMSAKYGADIGPMLQAHRAGYNFGGWYINLGASNEASVTATSWYTWTDDITVFAKWINSDTTYTIKVLTEDKSYDENGLAYADGTYTNFKTIKYDDYHNRLPAISDKELTVSIDSLSALKFFGFTYAGYNYTGDENAAGLIADTDSFTLTPNETGTSVVYLYYTRNKMELNFLKDSDISSGVHETTTVVYGDVFGPALPKVNPTKPGHDFHQWTDSHGNVIDADTSTNLYTANGSGAMFVYPTWAVRNYFLTYVPGEGTVFDTSLMGVGYTVNSEVPGGYTVAKSVDYGSMMGIMPNVSRKGHEFLGWKLQDGPSAGQHVDASTIVSVDNVIIKNDANSYEDTRVLYADYAPFEYELILDPGKGTVNPTSVHVVYGQPIPELPTPVYPGYTFVGWMLDVNDAAQTRLESGDIWSYITTNGASVKATAMYFANSYHYTLNLNDSEYGNGSTKASLYDTTLSGVDVPFDSEFALALKGIVAQRNGYKFLGWSTSTDKANLLNKTQINTLPQDSTLYAIWQPNVYTMKVVMHGGQFAEGGAGNSDWFNYHPYAQAHYESYAADYAEFGAKSLKATYDVETDTWSVPVIFDTTYGKLPTLERDGYRFDAYRATAPRWLDSNDNPVLDGKIVSSVDMDFVDWADDFVQFDAIWMTGFDFDLTSEPNAVFEDGTTGHKIMYQDDLIAAGKLPVVTKDGYTFMGWWTGDSETGHFVTFSEVTAMPTYAKFVAYFTPNVTFNGNGGKVVVDNQEHDSYTIGLQMLVDKYGRFFDAVHPIKTLVGWKAADEFDLSKFDNIKFRKEPLILDAQWDVMVKFVIPSEATWADGSTGSRYYSVSEIANWSEVPVPVLEGYMFQSWCDMEWNPMTITAMSKLDHSITVQPLFSTESQPPVNPTGINVTVTNYADGIATYAIPEAGWVEGENTLTVTSSEACRVALVRGEKEIKAVNNGNGSYGFTEMLQDGDELIIVRVGDANLDGEISVADLVSINQYLNNQLDFDLAHFLAADASVDADVTLDTAISVADLVSINQYLNNQHEFSWNLNN